MITRKQYRCASRYGFYIELRPLKHVSRQVALTLLNVALAFCFICLACLHYDDGWDVVAQDTVQVMSATPTNDNHGTIATVRFKSDTSDAPVTYLVTFPHDKYRLGEFVEIVWDNSHTSTIMPAYTKPLTPLYRDWFAGFVWLLISMILFNLAVNQQQYPVLIQAKELVKHKR